MATGKIASDFTTKPFSKRVEKPWGHEIIWAQTPEFTSKLIFIKRNHRLSYQYHEAKIEVLCLFQGHVRLYLDNSLGRNIKVLMEKEKGYLIQPHQRHRLEALKDSVVFEVSTPERGITFRIEDDYSRTDETETVRASKNRGWKAKF